MLKRKYFKVIQTILSSSSLLRRFDGLLSLTNTRVRYNLNIQGISLHGHVNHWLYQGLLLQTLHSYSWFLGLKVKILTRITKNPLVFICSYAFLNDLSEQKTCPLHIMWVIGYETNRDILLYCPAQTLQYAQWACPRLWLVSWAPCWPLIGQCWPW